MPSTLGSAAGYAFQEWLRRQVRASADAPVFPESAGDVAAHRQAVRRALARAAGPVPPYAPLEAEIHQVHPRDGYRIEAVSFPTFGGLRMTANAYVPDADHPVPGVLVVHGHSQHGRRDALTQRRAIALAKSGYFVLAVDAAGNGERSVELPGAYHGGYLAAALWLTGYSLFGLQLHENTRACDYLASRPEVDPSRLAISGASGGGNQSFYSGAWDERFIAVVPVCSTGAYRKLVGAHNCMCETPFGVAAGLEQYDVMAAMAPRALLVISAQVDHVSFRYEDARATMERASRLWDALGCPDKVAFAALPVGHGYSQPAREGCLGWFNRWLKGAVDATPVKEPDVQLEDYETLACYPGATTARVMTLPRFFAQARDAAPVRAHGATLDDVRRLFAPPQPTALAVEVVDRLPDLPPASPGATHVLRGSDGTLIPASVSWPDYTCTAAPVLLWVGDSREQLSKSPIARQALAGGTAVWAVDLPGLGDARLPGEINDYAERTLGLRGCASAVRACHLLGFGLAGYWIATLNALARAVSHDERPITLFASGGPATIVLAGAALLDGFDKLIVANPLASYRLRDTFWHVPFEAFIPDALRVGDIPDLAATAAPKPLTIVAPLAPDGTPLPVAEAQRLFAATAGRYQALGRRRAFHLVGPEEADAAFLADLTD